MMLFTSIVTLGLSLAHLSFVVANSNADASYKPTFDFQARNRETIAKIYSTTIYPNNVPILKNGSKATPPGLFNENATGRISPLGNFTGFDDSTEYFFALSPIPGQTGVGILLPNYNAFTSYTLHSFTSGCPEVASSIAYLNTTIYHPGSPDHGKYVTQIKEFASWRFDENGAVLYYDAVIPNLSLWFAKFTGADISNIAIQELDIATNLCPQIMDRCTGVNRQYGSELECIATLSLKPFGTFDETWGDNIVCRLVHIILTQVRPDVHCPHVGPTGGMKCVDVDYNDVYLADDVALFGGDDAFLCPETLGY